MNLIKYKPVEVAPFRWENVPLSLKDSLIEHWYEFLYRYFPKILERINFYQFCSRFLYETLANEIRKEVDAQIIAEIKAMKTETL